MSLGQEMKTVYIHYSSGSVCPVQEVKSYDRFFFKYVVSEHIPLYVNKHAANVFFFVAQTSRFCR